jgi:arginyl-tRNA synthetase
MQSWQSIIEKLLVKAGVTGEITFSTPPKPEMGDFAFPCFAMAKAAGKNPVEVAKELAGAVVLNPKLGIERVVAFGPYVNFFVRPEAMIADVVSAILEDKEKYGVVKLEKKKMQKVLIEYPSNNTHKEFHIGHFRNVCIGNTLVGLYRSNGHHVTVVNYLNDFGAHVAKCLWGLFKFHADEAPPENKQKWLGMIYAEASQYLVDHPEAADEVAVIQKQLEAKDRGIWRTFMTTREWSTKKFEALFKELGVKHDAVFFEKDIKATGQGIVDDLLKRGIATVGDGGAIIVDLSEYGLDVALVRKSNGVGLYLTSDLPLAELKFKKFAVDESIVITGQEQTFYFRQLYKILELMGFKKKLTHINYGLVTLPEGKMSSRTGNVILYEDLRDTVLESLLATTREHHPEWPDKKIHATAKALTMAALKFDMQKHEANKNIVFDTKEATSVEGFSGPYVLYAIARINSIVKKVGEMNGEPDFSLLTAPQEKELAVMLGNFGSVTQKALEQYNPSVIARYAFDTAKAFNDFYNTCSIAGAETEALKQARLALALAAKQGLINTLTLLSISPVEEM